MKEIYLGKILKNIYQIVELKIYKQRKNIYVPADKNRQMSQALNATCLYSQHLGEKWIICEFEVSLI